MSQAWFRYRDRIAYRRRSRGWLLGTYSPSPAPLTWFPGGVQRQTRYIDEVVPQKRRRATTSLFTKLQLTRPYVQVFV